MRQVKLSVCAQSNRAKERERDRHTHSLSLSHTHEDIKLQNLWEPIDYVQFVSGVGGRGGSNEAVLGGGQVLADGVPSLTTIQKFVACIY